MPKLRHWLLLLDNTRSNTEDVLKILQILCTRRVNFVKTNDTVTISVAKVMEVPEQIESIVQGNTRIALIDPLEDTLQLRTKTLQ